jgi:hypothetical protein
MLLIAKSLAPKNGSSRITARLAGTKELSPFRLVCRFVNQTLPPKSRQAGAEGALVWFRTQPRAAQKFDTVVTFPNELSKINKTNVQCRGNSIRGDRTCQRTVTFDFVIYGVYFQHDLYLDFNPLPYNIPLNRFTILILRR